MAISPITILLDLFFPRFCCSCGNLGRFLCFKCYETLDFLTGEIKIKHEPNYLDQLQAAVQFDEVCRPLLHALKYQSVKAIGNWCGDLLYLTVDIPPVDLVTFIPLHPSKQHQRGFNQAEVIGRQLAQNLQLPCLPLLARDKETAIQASLKNDAQRALNMMNSFIFNSDYLSLKLQNQRLLIIDDVTTTGATLNEAAKVLKVNGFQKVYGLTVAHGQ